MISEFVGKLKLSFIMTKGQLEVEVISAHGLKFDHESTLGKYTKRLATPKSPPFYITPITILSLQINGIIITRSICQNVSKGEEQEQQEKDTSRSTR